MFGKKKKQEAVVAQRSTQQPQRVRRQPQQPVRTASWQKVNAGPVPVARPADHIQLTPIVQPIPLVPYSTQRQPLAIFEDDFDDYDD